MKILMITPYLPYPLLSGGQTRSYNLIKNLASKHRITLFSFIREEGEIKFKHKLAPFCHKVEVFLRRPAWSMVNVFLAAVTPFPFLVAIYLSWKVRKKLKMELEKEDYDLIHAETFYVMPNIPQTSIPILLVEQTIEYQVYQHFVQTSVPLPLKLLLWLDVAKVKFWEKHFWKKASKVVAMSKADKKKMQKIISSLKVDIVPNGVDVSLFSKKKSRPSKKNTILYVGNFKWLQNREAATILIKEIWPKIKKKVPTARLWIIGRNPTDELKRLSYHDVIFDETIADIYRAYQRADLLLAPIKGPGGTRLKILEAMASGCPVVTTPVGIEGIEATPGRHFLLAKNNDQLANLSITVLKNESLREKIVNDSCELVRKKYDWVDITKKLEEVYRKVRYGQH